MGLSVAFNLLKSEHLMTLRLATLCSFLVGSVALAQNTTVLPRLAILRVDDPNLDTYTFGAAQCNDTLTLTWSNTLINPLSNICAQLPLKLWSTAGECGNEPVSGDTTYPDVDSLSLNAGTRSGNFTVKISELPGFKTGTFADGGMNAPCGSTETTITHRVCGSVKTAQQTGFGCSEQTFTPATSLRLVYDTQPPSAPTIETPTPQDEAVKVTFSVDSDTTVVLLEVKSPTDPDFRQIAEGAATTLSIRGDRLENNVPYLVRLRARDDAGNVSLPSAEVTITPIKTIGLFGVWAANGGTDAGGCSTAAGMLPLLVLAFAFRRARKQVRKDS